MRDHTYADQNPLRDDELSDDGDSGNAGLPNRLLTAFEVAEYIG